MAACSSEDAIASWPAVTAVSSGSSGGQGCGRYLGNESGFTLVEVLVAVLLMVVGLFAVVQMQIVALSQTSIAYRLTTASALAQSTLEDVLASGSNDSRLSLTSTVTTVTTPPPVISNITYTVSCTSTFDATLSRYKIVVVVAGGGRNVTLTGYKGAT